METTSNSPKIIGITGGIGSGKSLISSLFDSLGYPTYNSDYEAKKLYKDPSIRSQVIKLFGIDTYSGEQLNREVLGKKVFSNKMLLQQLNDLIHPAVGKHFKTWAASQSTPFAFKEAAILIESGAYKSCYAILTVSAPEDLRISRVIGRDDVSEADVRARMSKQLSDAEREAYAKWIVLNNGTTSVIRQVMQIHAELTASLT